MYANNIAIIATLATVALGAPAPGGGQSNNAAGASGGATTINQANQQCGNGQSLSCCSSDSSSSGGLLGGVGNGLLGGSCSQIPLSFLSLNVPVADSCGNNVAACCQGDQNGLVNVQCIPITVAV